MNTKYHEGNCEREMMCHPTIGDLLLRSRDRVLPGTCLRPGMRPGRDVFDLHGRVPGGGPGCRIAGHAGALAPPQEEVDRSSQELISVQIAGAQQHSGAPRVELNERMRSLFREAQRRTECMMTKGTSSPVLHRDLSQRARVRAAVRARRELHPAGLSAARRRRQPQMTFTFRVAGLDAPRSYGPLFSQNSRRTSQNNAGGEQISNGVDRCYAEKAVTRASVIVLVTTKGNATVRAN